MMEMGESGANKYERLYYWVKDNYFLRKPQDGSYYPKVKKWKVNFDQLGCLADMIDQSYEWYGDDWVEAVTYVVNGNIDPLSGPGTYYAAFQNKEKDDPYSTGFAFWDSHFHEDFRDDSSQVQHFWAPFANTIGTGDWGGIEAYLGAYRHDVLEATIGHDDATAEDYALSLVAIDLAEQVNSGELTANELADQIRNPEGPLGLDGPGSNGFVDTYADSWPWGYIFEDMEYWRPFP